MPDINIKTTEDLSQFLQNNRSNIQLDIESILKFDYNKFNSNELLFFIHSENVDIEKEILNKKLKFIFDNINYLKKIKIENGIKLYINDILYEIKYKEEDKINLNNPYRILNDVVIINNNEEIYMTNFQYIDLVNKLKKFEIIQNIYSEVLYNYIKDNISKVNLNSPFIYYGYLNKEIVDNIKRKLEENN